MSLISGAFSTFLRDLKHIVFSCFLASLSPLPLSVHVLGWGFFALLVSL